MLPRRFPRGLRASRLPPVRQLGHMDYYNAQESLLPTMMDDRRKSWAKPGSEIHPQLDCVLYNGRVPQEITDLILEYVLSPDVPALNIPGDPLSAKSSHEFCLRNDHKQSSDEPKTQPPICNRNQAENEAGSTTDDQGGDELPDIILLGHNTMSNTASRRLLVVRERRELGFDWLRPGCNHKTTYSGWRLLQTCRRIYLDAEKFLARNREIVVFEGREPVDGYSFTELARRARDNHAQPRFQHIPSIHMYSQMYHLVGLSHFPLLTAHTYDVW